MKGGVDLHLHSTASDGAFTPEDVARRARNADLKTVALSDHDTTAGIAAFEAAMGTLRVIPAIELTARVREGPSGTVHLLGYGIDLESELLQDVARRNRQGKRANIREILEGMGTHERIHLDWEEVAGGRDDDAYVGRHHIAGVLVRKGLVRTRQRAFRRFLGSNRVPPVEVVSAKEALDAIHAAGGISVLAHPTQEDLDRHLRPLVALGVQGIEIYRPRVMEHRQVQLGRHAEKHGLLITGGSDWHGHHPEKPLGDWRPPVVPLEPFLAKLDRGILG